LIFEKVMNAEAIIPSGSTVEAPEILFAKIQNKKEPQWQALIDKEKASLAELIKKFEAEEKAAEQVQKNNAKMEAKGAIEYDDFAKLELRVGTIETAERVPKKDRLLHLSVNLGTETRCIVSGIAEHYAPEELLQKQVVVVANLKPKKLAGIESHGMILTAETAEGKLKLVLPNEMVDNGSVVK
jgi:methionyl-tRNA synthetase